VGGRNWSLPRWHDMAAYEHDVSELWHRPVFVDDAGFLIIMIYLKTLLLGLLSTAFSLTAPFAVPFALLFTKRDATALAWSWYDTPDEPALIGLYEPQIAAIYGDGKGWRWWAAAWWWFGIRNTGHGFASLFAVPVDQHWPEGNGMWRNGELFAMRYQLWLIQFFYGWAIYASAKGGLEARPKISIKTRNAT